MIEQVTRKVRAAKAPPATPARADQGQAIANENGNDQFNRIASVLQKLVETEGRQFESTAVADEVIDLKLYSEDDEI